MLDVSLIGGGAPAMVTTATERSTRRRFTLPEFLELALPVATRFRS